MNAGMQLIKYITAFSIMIPMLIVGLVVGIFSRQLAWIVFRKANYIFLRIFGVTVKFEYDADPKALSKGGIIVGLNQESLLEPTLGFAALNRKWTSIFNIEYALLPVLGWVAWVLGWIIVRQWPKQSQAQLKRAARYAQNGGLVYLSAEGKRSKDGRLNPYKKGPAVLAIQSQSQVHPIYVHGSAACMPYGDWKIRPGTVLIRFLQPISVKGLTYDDRDQLMSVLRELGEAEHRKSPVIVANLKGIKTLHTGNTEKACQTSPAGEQKAA
ncbi:hypothetical protein CAI21_19570 [Alkalilimnicola ehrlichii]|uniref:Phospholipid/glycerol acyltransferase domain-containing protein n=1 Tax=Alkalilimnicola ehrlichii TaxID=351052 RepID=A0A3E0WI27_9GAMM|nr:lysophospholipid acyltransferase family protein [Alkalilimnicola ehrlichii]RFA25313.1 hypothetical protein CAI21_19570 [Alkalilimnicola ehrlichii]RFA32428.1 hypothetical protein CAL65_19780 [Alkalilimnicola ehrlichii]